jgi:hypothetical protein
MSKLDLTNACVSTEAQHGWTRTTIYVAGKAVAWRSVWRKLGSETGVILDGKRYAHLETYLKTGYFQYVPDSAHVGGVIQRPLAEGSEEIDRIKDAIGHLTFDLPVCTR